MEQRDAIVRNLREISHFFLSESKKNDDQEHIESPEPDNTNARHANDAYTHNTDVSDKIIPVKPKRATIAYVIHDQKETDILHHIYLISMQLALHKIPTSTVVAGAVYDLLAPHLPDGYRAERRYEHNKTIEIMTVYSDALPASLQFIGRTDNASGAQLTPYLVSSEMVFMLDCSYQTVSNIIRGKHDPAALFFTQPTPENAFKIYYMIKKLYASNAQLKAGLVVTDVREQSEAVKISSSISKTLIKYGHAPASYIGSLSQYAINAERSACIAADKNIVELVRTLIRNFRNDHTTTALQ